jgi:hypothetical protein
MKRLLLVALMVLVTLVGMVGFSRAGKAPATQSVTPVIENKQPSLDAISNDQINLVSALQASANATNEAVGGLNKALVDIPGNVGVAAARAKMYYLTENSFDGGDAIMACDPRFHIARISEIQDPSNLQYATRSITVYDSLVDDPGLGPTADRMGWVYTGSLPLAGVPDYSDYSMSSIDQQNGITVAFHVHNIWGDLSMDPFSSDPTTGWQTAHRLLSYPQPVWCVGDPE